MKPILEVEHLAYGYDRQSLFCTTSVSPFRKTKVWALWEETARARVR